MLVHFVGPIARKRSGMSDLSVISSVYMCQVLERLEFAKNRKSTRNNYLQIWHAFNKFLMRLDTKPVLWEHSTVHT